MSTIIAQVPMALHTTFTSPSTFPTVHFSHHPPPLPQTDLTLTSAFEGDEVLGLGVFTDHQVADLAFSFSYSSPQDELERILSTINTWGLDVFTANNVIREQRVLTCTTFR